MEGTPVQEREKQRDIPSPSSKRARVEEDEPTPNTEGVLALTERLRRLLGRRKKFLRAAAVAERFAREDLTPTTAAPFFTALEAAMEARCEQDKDLKAAYYTLFHVCAEQREMFPEHLARRLDTFVVRTVLSDDCNTDDSFQFAKTIKKLELLVPSATDTDTDDDRWIAERMEGLLAASRIAFRSYRWPWARVPLNSLAKVLYGSLVWMTPQEQEQVKEWWAMVQRRQTERVVGHGGGETSFERDAKHWRQADISIRGGGGREYHPVN